MRTALLAFILVLAGCDQTPELTIGMDEWVCSKVARMETVTPLFAGKAVVPQTNSRLECVQWSRMGEQP